MAEIATIARPYAQALYQANRTNLEATWVWVAELGTLATSPDLRLYVENPKTSLQQVLGLLAKLMQNPLPEQGKNLVKLLLTNGRLPVMAEIAAQFKALKNAVSGVSEALVHSAFALSDEQQTQLQCYLEGRFGRKLQLIVQLDSSLIAGVRVAVGDEVLDMSAHAQLEKMKMALAASCAR